MIILGLKLDLETINKTTSTIFANHKASLILKSKNKLDGFCKTLSLFFCIYSGKTRILL